MAEVEPVSVAVIGAGMAGLIAARQLHRKNIDVVVLESAARPGGRVLPQAMEELDEAALDCALDLLISGQPGFIEHSSTTYNSSDGAWLQISATGALTRRFGVYDLGGNEGAVGPVKLKSKAYFEGCKAEPDVQQRYLCFVAWTDDAEPAALCDEPGDLPSEF